MPWTNELLASIQFQNHEHVQQLLESGTSADRESDDHPIPVSIAIEQSDIEMVSILLAHGANVNQQDSDGESPLHCTTQDTVKYETMKLIVQNGGNVNCLNKWGRTALHYSCYDGDLNKMELLLSKPGIQVNGQDEDGYNCLHAFITDYETNHDPDYWGKGIDMLVQAGVDVNAADNEGRSVLHLATEQESLEELIVKTLLDRCLDLYLEQTDVKGNSILHLAANNNFSREFFATFLEGKFKIFSPSNLERIKTMINKENKRGKTPFTIFLFQRSHPELETLQNFLDAGTDVNKLDNCGRTPLHRIMKQELASYRSYTCMLLLNAGADVNLPDVFGVSPIFWARTREEIECLCSNAYANMGLTDKHGRTALMNTSIERTLDTVTTMASKGCDVNATDKYGSNLLHYHAWANNVEHLEHALQLGCNPEITDNDGRTPCALAELLGHWNVRQTLVEFQKSKQPQGDIEIIYDQSKHSPNHKWSSNQLTVKYDDISNKLKLKEDMQIQGSKESLAKELFYLPGSGILLEEDETASVFESVKRLVNRVSVRISQHDPRFTNELFPVGSMREKTKTGYPDEFDFVFCLSNILSYCEIETDDALIHDGFVWLKLIEGSNVPKNMKRFFDKKGYFSTYQIRMELVELVSEILLEQDIWEGIELLSIGEVAGFDDKPIINFQVLWVGTIYKGLKISVDFVPAIRFQKYIPGFYSDKAQSQAKTAEKAGFFLLLHTPEAIQRSSRFRLETSEGYFISLIDTDEKDLGFNEEMEERDRNRLRISVAPKEIAFMDSLPQMARNSYILAKIIIKECPMIDFSEQKLEDDSDSYEDFQVVKIADQTEEQKGFANVRLPDSDGESDDSIEGHVFSANDASSQSLHSNASHFSESSNEDTKPVFEANECISSYMLKNALFHVLDSKPNLLHINEFPNDEECWRATVGLTMNIFEVLKSKAKKRFHGVFFLPRQNIFQFKFEFERIERKREMDRVLRIEGERIEAFSNLILAVFGEH